MTFVAFSDEAGRSSRERSGASVAAQDAHLALAAAGEPNAKVETPPPEPGRAAREIATG